MNPSSENLNLSELEQLAQAYFDCRLDRAEEMAFKRVLSESPHHSPLLEQCRAAMGLEVALARAGRPRRRLPKAVWLSAAASVAVLIAVIPTFLSHTPDPNCEVYIGGQRITDRDTAIKMAQREMESDMQTLDNANRETRFSAGIANGGYGTSAVCNTSADTTYNKDTVSTFNSFKVKE